MIEEDDAHSRVCSRSLAAPREPQGHREIDDESASLDRLVSSPSQSRVSGSFVHYIRAPKRVSDVDCSAVDRASRLTDFPREEKLAARVFAHESP